MQKLKSFLNNIKYLFLGFTVLIFLMEALFVKEVYEFLFFPIVFLVIANIWIFNLDYKKLAKLGVGILLILPVLLLFKLNWTTEKVSLLAYTFFATALVKVLTVPEE